MTRILEAQLLVSLCSILSRSLSLPLYFTLSTLWFSIDFAAYFLFICSSLFIVIFAIKFYFNTFTCKSQQAFISFSQIRALFRPLSSYLSLYLCVNVLNCLSASCRTEHVNVCDFHTFFRPARSSLLSTTQRSEN